MKETAEYRAWRAMKQRCNGHPPKCLRNYVARGITVCDEWAHDFMAFYNHVGPRPSPQYTLDRIDNDGNYEPGNVRWATWDQQSNNRRPPRRA